MNLIMSNPLFYNFNLKTERLIVRPFKRADAEGLHHVVSQPKIFKFLPESIMTLQEVRDIIEWFQDCYRENKPDKIKKWTLAIVWNKTSEIIGWCGLGPLDFNPDEIEIFCGLSESYWGKGIAAEACTALLDYSFRVIGLARIVAVVNPENLQSRKLIEKLGMRQEKQVKGLPKEHKHYEGCIYYSMPW